MYVGLHKTKKIDDGYMGSSRFLQEDIANLGIINFKKEILYHCSSESEMEQLEERIVDNEFLKGFVYNLMPGGKYGSPDRNGFSFSGRHHSDETKKRISTSKTGLANSISARLKMSQNNFARRQPEAQRIHVRNAGRLGGLAGKGVTRRMRSGEDSPNFGKKREKVQCPHCKKCGAKNVMIRWHFSNCRFIAR